MTLSDDLWMRRALRLAGRGRGRVEPNPMVGCVIVRDGVLLGEGWHRRFGGPHAEIEALNDCKRRGHDPAGAMVYVTLEPCAHHGKTPPCVMALIEARVAKVVVAMEDPYAEVAGRGIKSLQEADILVTRGIEESHARLMNEAYLMRLSKGRPWVIAKWAQTLDGRIAAASGDSQWISNSYSRRWTHKLRGRVDAIVIGIGTLLADDAKLTARDVPIRRLARRVIVDPQLRIPTTCALLQPDGKGIIKPPVTLAVGPALNAAQLDKQATLEAAGVEIVSLPLLKNQSSALDLRSLLEHLSAAHQATNVLVEGGAGLLGHLLRQSLVDEVVAFIAPRLLADGQAVPVARGMSRPRIDDATKLDLRRIKRLGDDVLLNYRVVNIDG